MACLGARLLSTFMMFGESSQENGLNKEPFINSPVLELLIMLNNVIRAVNNFD